MFFCLVFTAVVLHITYAGNDGCPSLVQMGPCACRDDPWNGLVVVCNGSLVDEIRYVLTNVANSKQRILHLKLEDVRIPSLPPNFLPGPYVRILTIHNCSTSAVDKDAFVDVAATLVFLHLTNNALERVPSHALEKCFNLSNLYLDNNRIEMLHAGDFMGLNSLNILTLIGNRIKFIDNSAFVGIGRKFNFLKLGDNELTAFPFLPLRNLSSLGYLYLENNKIASIQPEELDALGGKPLRQLILSDNSIRHLPARVFSSLKSMYYLALSGNAIESIHPSAFEGTEGTLQYLYLDYNQLEEVPSAALKDMRALLTVYLRNNKICKIRKDDFLTYGRRLTAIYLQNNSLEYIDANAFIGLDSLIYLWLGSNQLKTFPFETVAPVSDTLQSLDIHDNPLHCDCNLNWMKKHESWMERRSNETKCATPKNYTGVLLTEIGTDELVCDDNNTSNPTEPCCNCFINTQQRVSSNALMSILQISFTYLLTTVITKRLF